MATHEGIPLALRVRPNADTAESVAAFPVLAAITHHLEHVQASGLPEPGYNRFLASLDAAAIEASERSGCGLTVLVETLAGQRTYYAYVSSPLVAQQAHEALCRAFPSHEFTLQQRPDQGWGLYALYRKRFAW